MRRELISAAVAVALLATLGVPLASASEAGSGYVWLYDNGVSTPTTSTMWQFYVEVPTYVAQDEPSGYWNFTVYAEHSVGLSTLNGTWTVTIYINDGVVNESAGSGTIVVTHLTAVYCNKSMPAATYDLLSVNSSATFYTVLNLNGTAKDSYRTAIDVEATGTLGLVHALTGAVIVLMVIMLVVGLFSSLMVSMQKSMSKTTGGGDCNRKGRKKGKKG